MKHACEIGEVLGSDAGQHQSFQTVRAKKMLRLKVFNVMFQGNFQSVSWQRQMLPVLICIQRLLQYYNPQSSCHIRSGLIKMKGEFTKQPSDMDSALDALWSGDIYPSALGMTRMGARLWN